MKGRYPLDALRRLRRANVDERVRDVADQRARTETAESVQRRARDKREQADSEAERTLSAERERLEAGQARVADLALAAKSDNVKAWELSLDGSYVRADGGKEPRVRSQYRFMELARERARDTELARTRTLAPAQPPGVTIVNKLRKGKRKKKGQRRDDD